MYSFRLLPLLLGIAIPLLISAVVADTCNNGMLYAAEAPNEYYYCVNGVLHHQTCPGDDSYFDAHLSVCRHGKPFLSSTVSPPSPLPSTSSSPPSPSTSPPSPAPSPSAPDDNVEVLGKCQRIGQTGDLTNCNRFYHCAAKGEAVQRGNCPDNHIFDLVKFACVRGTC